MVAASYAFYLIQLELDEGGGGAMLTESVRGVSEQALL